MPIIPDPPPTPPAITTPGGSSAFAFDPIFPEDDPTPDDMLRDAEADDFDPIETTEIIDALEDAPRPFGRSWRFDFVTKRFVLQPRRGPLNTYDVETMKGWIEKCLRTARGAHPVERDSYGIDNPYHLIGDPWEEGALEDWQELVNDALQTHPRIVGAVEFAIDLPENSDAAFISFTVVLDNEAEIEFRELEVGSDI